MLNDKLIDIEAIECKLDFIIKELREIKTSTRNNIEVETGEISKKAKKENFSNFSFDVFATDKIEGEKKSQRENMLEISSICENFAINDEHYNLLFYGSTGLGKTYMANCIANDMYSRGKNVKIYSSVDLFQMISNSLIHRENVKGYSDIRNCDLLIIDNLGSEKANDFVMSQLYNLIDYRENHLNKTIITTNLKPAKIGKVYTQRILSRILGEYRLIKFIGDDLRWSMYK